MRRRVEDKNGRKIPVRIPLYDHQSTEIAYHWRDKIRARPWQCRSGKSAVSIVETCELYRDDKIDAEIVIAPSRVHHAWALDEFPKHATAPFFAYSWSCQDDDRPRDRILRAMVATAKPNGRMGVLCVNKEALLVERVWRWMKRFAGRYRCKLDVDESHHFGGPGTKGTKRLRALANRCEYRRILSGTMVGNSPGRVYSQFQILREGCLGFDTAEDFLRAYAVTRADGRGRRKVVPGKWRDLEDLRRRLARWGTPVLRSDIPGMPPIIVSTEYTELDAEARGRYETAMYVANLCTPPNYQDARRAAMAGKAEACVDMLPTMLEDGPVMIWAPFHDVVDPLAEYLRGSGIPAVSHHGGMTTRKRAAAIKSGLDCGGVIVSTPDSLAEGMDLSRAEGGMIWYAPPWDVVTFGQAVERCTRMYGRPVPVTMLCALDTIEHERMYSGLRRKADMADWLMGSGMKEIQSEGIL